MPENNQILSVEGQLIGMPTAGPESFSQQQLDYLKRALGVDETVLWSGTAGPITSNGTLSLSETPSNFEYIKFEYLTSAGSVSRVETIKVNYDDESVIFQFSCGVWNVGSNNDYALYLDRFFANVLTATPTTLNYYSNGNRQNINGGTSGGTSSRGITLYKIVGIHRIAGGN